MICRNCNSIVEDGRDLCPNCGARLTDDGPQKNAGAALFGGFAIGKAAREQRLTAVISEGQLISTRVYNCIMAAVVLWGVLVNYLLCRFVGDVFRFGISPVVFYIGYFACLIAGVIIAGKSQKPLISFLGYNLVVLPLGILIASVVSQYGGVNSKVVADAFLYLLLISAGVTCAAIAFPQLFAKLGGALLAVLIGLIVCEVVLLLLGVRQTVTHWIAAGLFSLYLGFDIYRSQQFPKTVDNAVDCALDIYLDIVNLFIRLLSILGSSKKDD